MGIDRRADRQPTRGVENQRATVACEQTVYFVLTTHSDLREKNIAPLNRLLILPL